MTIALQEPGEALEEELPDEIKNEFEYEVGGSYRLYSLSKEETQDLLGGTKIDARDFVVRSEEYGVPQARHRVFIVGVRGDLTGRPPLLERDTNEVSVRQMIGDMPALRSGLSGKKGDSEERWTSAIRRECESRIPDHEWERLGLEALVSKIEDREWQYGDNGRGDLVFIDATGTEEPFNGLTPDVRRWIADPRLCGFIGHDTRSHMASDLARYLYCSSSAEAANTPSSSNLENWKAPNLLPDHANVRSHTDNNGKLVIRADTNSDRFRVQAWNGPSKTITSHISKDGHAFIHPDPVQCRSLTVREAARLQTFPDNYFLAGLRTAQYHQVENAVPPYLAKQIAESVFQFLKKNSSSG